MVAKFSVFFSNHFFLLMVLFFLVTMVPAAAAATANGGCYHSIFNFGDDVSDTGNYIFFHPQSSNFSSSSSSAAANTNNTNNNNNNFTDIVAHNDLPYDGMTTYLKMPSGRASNGKLIIDFVAEAMGLPPLPPYLARLASSSPTDYPDYSKGANFALIGANSFDHTHFHNNTIKKKKTLFRQQFNWFNDLLTSLCSSTTTTTAITTITTTYNRNKTTTTTTAPSSTTTSTTTVDDSCIQRYLKNSLFHIGGIGTYDYRLYDNIADLETMVGAAVEEISNLIDQLIHLGAENFMVAGLPPIGCFPAASTKNYSRPHETTDDENACVFELNSIARHHNTLIQRYLDVARDWIRPATFIYADYYKVVEFIKSPTEYGFTNTREACVTTEGTDNNIKKCENPDTYVFWDESHMTEAAYQIIAANAITGKSNTPSLSLLSSKC